MTSDTYFCDTYSQLLAGQLSGIKRLDLSGGLKEFPREIFSLADSLEVLNLSGNQLTELPADLHRLHRLKVIFCSDNLFSELPIALGRCPSLDTLGFKANQIQSVEAAALPERLRWLILTDNALEALPTEIGNRPALQKLMLAGNRLQKLPADLAKCSNLELVRIAANRLTTFPACLLDLPKLAWLAFSGNPFSAPVDANQAPASIIPELAWESLQLGKVLGEGASGVIHEGRVRQHGNGGQRVAIKIFKGDITSDGRPSDEMDACLAAGKHAHLIGALAKISHHPLGLHGLVMPLLNETYQALAQPPSLDSCTRDIYDSGLAISAESAAKMIKAASAALTHLHKQGLSHGDLYAHNLLVDPTGNALLSDFGAASRTSALEPGALAAVLRFENRALRILIEEITSRCANVGELSELLA
ncbi:leucine-rich repeat-containing protein kinase family protein [Xylophilus sp. GOD-11R]|uniref:leucine-rich repeat-containing protein kinase family protein n=1 Tax=Xylophilus sp. GOD-11R TaxID=3089814 RepID=UPI00298D3BBE|nr:leucine-rich repeat-containing protein kinase family protein [Xylophilus sp. GOD-11R]WPB58668.1 leucine-rich repeat-containing protein kinase family protein [Xylophilus sp. GOD-11R]